MLRTSGFVSHDATKDASADPRPLELRSMTASSASSWHWQRSSFSPVVTNTSLQRGAAAQSTACAKAATLSADMHRPLRSSRSTLASDRPSCCMWE